MTDHYPPFKRCSDCDEAFEADTGNSLCPDCNREYDRLDGAMTQEAAHTKHTPGPWRFGTILDMEDEDSFCLGGTDAEGWTIDIARVTFETDEDTANANARLILSAPAMLAALEAAMRHLNEEAESHGDDWDLRATLDAAIAQARGEKVEG